MEKVSNSVLHPFGGKRIFLIPAINWVNALLSDCFPDDLLVRWHYEIELISLRVTLLKYYEEFYLNIPMNSERCFW